MSNPTNLRGVRLLGVPADQVGASAGHGPFHGRVILDRPDRENFLVLVGPPE